MRFLPLTVLLLAVPSFNPALAQDAGFTTDDEVALTSCIEAGRDLGEQPGALIAGMQCVGAASNLCQEEAGGSSTPGITACNARETAWWDRWLNDNYETVIQSLEPDVADALKTAQRAWITWRDAKCAFLYQYWIEGTIRSNIASYCQMETTAQRAFELATLIDGEN